MNTEDGGSAHVVGLGELRVLVFAEGDDEWYAHGLEIDYVAQGTSLENVKDSFHQGLVATVREHLVLFGSIEKLLQPAEPEIWHRYLMEAAEGKLSFSQASLHVLDEPCEEAIFTATTDEPSRKRAGPKKAGRKKPQELPFERITYAQPAVEAA
jgi:hypothetical protein